MFSTLWMSALILATAVPAADSGPYRFQQKQMGVIFTITVYAPSKIVANRAATAAFQRIAQLNGILSDYDPNSELSRLGKTSGPGKPVKVSPDLLRVLTESLAISRRTNGAFDVTVGHLTRQWRRAKRRKRLPNAETLKEALAKTGYQHVRIAVKRSTVELMKPDMRLDLGGIAKGYAADEAMRVLKKHGITRAMVDGSGDITLGDAPPGKPGWKVGIASLKKPDAPPTRFLILKNTAIATSGDAYQFVEISGKRYSHIVDPKTGLGLSRRSSVTVIAKSGMAADSLASAVTVLGKQRGLCLIANTRGAETLILQIKNGKPIEAVTDGFRKKEARAKSQWH